MRWTESIERKPYHGETRIVSKFAIFPIVCENGEAAWLEKVNIKQEYRIDPSGDWHNMNFV